MKITCAIIGAPNSGKSTFVNYFVKLKVCIVSPRPHTTTENTIGILEVGNTQIVFIDTPGINVLRKKYSNEFRKIAMRAVNNCDLQIFLFDCLKPIRMDIIEIASTSSQNKICILNKIDMINKGRLLPLAQELSRVFEHIFFISSTTGMHCDKVLKFILQNAKDSTWEFPSKIKTTRSMKSIIIDKIKESLFQFLLEELPYKVQVEIDEIEDKDILTIHASLITTKSSKLIIISLIKKIGTYARHSLMKFFKKKCNLFLTVKKS